MGPSPIDYPSLWPSHMQFQTSMPGYRVQGNPFGAPPHQIPHFASPARGSYPNSPSFGGCRHTNPRFPAQRAAILLMDQWVTHTHHMVEVEVKTTIEAQAQGGEGGGSGLVSVQKGGIPRPPRRA